MNRLSVWCCWLGVLMAASSGNAADQCTSPIECNDGNECTEDVCEINIITGNRCVHVALTGAECTDDGDVFTGDHCVNGECTHWYLCPEEGDEDTHVCTMDIALTFGGACEHPVVNSAECRKASGTCDLSESCDGVALDCPPDAHEPDGTVCGADGRVMLALVLEFIPEDAPIVAAVDDTLNRKTGKRIWPAGMHHDPLLSTARRAVFSFGHNWVVLSLQLRLSFAPDKVWSLPILMRLYRRKQKKRQPGRPRGERKAIGQASPSEYRTRPQLASEMIAILASWVPQRTIHVVGDSEYAGKSISRHLPDKRNRRASSSNGWMPDW